MEPGDGANPSKSIVVIPVVLALKVAKSVNCVVTAWEIVVILSKIADATRVDGNNTVSFTIEI
jgi:hypothetical protein